MRGIGVPTEISCPEVDAKKQAALVSFSANSKRLRLAVPPLVLLQQLDAVVAVELDGPPVTVVVDQQGALLQAALAVGLGGDSQFVNVLSQVLFYRCALRLRPGTLQDTSLSYTAQRKLKNVPN